MQTRILSFAAAMAGAAFLAGQVQASEDFDGPVLTGPTQAPDTWYTDRYAPAGFDSGVAFDGRQVLEVDISAADGASNRPGAYSGSFYDTQGRKLDLADGTTSMSIELYIDSTWASESRRMAGFWGTAFDGADALSSYPIISFHGSDGFQGWNGASYVTFGVPTGFAYGTWATLNISLQGDNWLYQVGDKTLLVDANGSTELGNVILQAHNTSQGANYSVRWDNLVTGGVVPEPATWAMMITGFGLSGAMLRRRRTTAVMA
ncbi:MAG: PEPxxWA-CTERM sorting domain-containing protein [Phenylobacterium sp.]|uniref:PEPxxWA-CTERM sorting domain-containing protein n=1 Tax=Phenylobacterium sp. TaxID=1871053 RepID=UPI002733A0AD|nr:PEPxxWA-CTERM sorting domain-containing protein [Phenylobacterium sp.]MDP3747098.1 PEPxxWA-CTERM sorting domain-containing protein [Phenylobacterium sp.]